MSRLLSEVRSFIDALQGQQAWVEELNEHSHKIANHFSDASAAEIRQALEEFAALIPDVPLVAAGLVAINCGSLVEHGGDPETAGPALLDKLPRILETAADFYRRVRPLAVADSEFLAAVRDDLEIEEDELSAKELIDECVATEGWRRLADQYGPVLFQDHPAAVLGYMSEEFFQLGVIAHLSRSAGLRAAARSRPELLEQTLQLDDLAGSHRSFLACMLNVLDDESLLVLHVEQRKGFDVRISGIADNFQLHTLLAGAVIGKPAQGWVAGKAPSARAVAEFRDATPGPQGGANVTGPFNLCNWTALSPDGTLAEGQTGEATDHWIWNEGWPAEIVPFEGRRVVLLGTPPYARMWRAGRAFSGMVGELTVERTLGAEEVDDWLHRIATAPRTS